MSVTLIFVVVEMKFPFAKLSLECDCAQINQSFHSFCLLSQSNSMLSKIVCRVLNLLKLKFLFLAWLFHSHIEAIILHSNYCFIRNIYVLDYPTKYIDQHLKYIFPQFIPTYNTSVHPRQSERVFLLFNWLRSTVVNELAS